MDDKRFISRKRNDKYPYSYFVGYSFFDPVKSSYGTGMTNICLEYPIKVYEDILLLKKLVEESSSFKDVVIINYQLLNNKGI